MRKFGIKDASIGGIAVQQEIQRADESRQDHGLHGILMIGKPFRRRKPGPKSDPVARAA
jgi:hypothetical protein